MSVVYCTYVNMYVPYVYICFTCVLHMYMRICTVCMGVYIICIHTYVRMYMYVYTVCMCT